MYLLEIIYEKYADYSIMVEESNHIRNSKSKI
jgi:hypothetical protein